MGYLPIKTHTVYLHSATQLARLLTEATVCIKAFSNKYSKHAQVIGDEGLI